jgi:hypothetical protein
MIERGPRSLAQRLLWFLTLWLAAVASVAFFSLLLRFLLTPN